MDEVRIAKIKASAETRQNVIDFLRHALTNPLVGGLLALALNQGLYKAGLWNPRASPDGKFRTYRSKWGIDAEGIHFGDRVWVEADPEQIAADNATIIGQAILAGMIAYASKAPIIQPVTSAK